MFIQGLFEHKVWKITVTYSSHHEFLLDPPKEDLHRKLGIFILPIVSDWTNVFIVTWLSYAEEELTYSLALAPDWLTKR